MLDNELIESLRQKLLEQQASLNNVSESGEQAAQTVELDQSRVGRLSRMDALQEQAMSKERLRRRELELVRISKALQRIANGDFGDCLECGEFIAQARLAFNPAVEFCLACASAREQK